VAVRDVPDATGEGVRHTASMVPPVEVLVCAEGLTTVVQGLPSEHRMTETLSERLFARFCDSVGIQCVRISAAIGPGELRPDYSLVGRLGTSVVAEVKQFDPSPEEKTLMERSHRGEVVVTGGVPGARLREVIDKANAQLKALSHGEKPGILVVYNNVSASSHHTDPYAVLTAMRGLDVVPVLVPHNPMHSPTFLEARPGPKKKLRADANTHISAIAVLFGEADDMLGMVLYHNPHARVPLDSRDLGFSGVTQFVMRQDQSGWDRVISAS
jgi:hypothetical protein